MDAFLGWMLARFQELGSLLETVAFSYAGISFTLMDFLLGAIAISIVLSVFWKGAKG